MLLSNSTVADLLSFSLGMLPSQWARLAKQKFNQSLFFNPLPASGNLSRTFQADTDSWWIGLGAAATSRDTATAAIVTDRPITVTIRSSSGGREFQSQAEDFDNVFGTAQLPAVWGAPLFVKPAAAIEVSLTNLVATARNVRISFYGFKIFNTDMGE